MSQPVKLSDSLVLDARLTGKLSHRSIAGQIEFWAGLGRAIEGLLRGNEVLKLQQAGAARPLSDCLSEVGKPAGQRRIADYLKSRPYPHYEPANHRPGYLVRTEESGKRSIGRFVNRIFVVAEGDASS